MQPKTIEITKTVPIKKEYLIKVQWNHEQYVRFREEAKATNKDQVQISSYVGIDLRKKALQVEIQDSKGSILPNKKKNRVMFTRKEFVGMPKDARCVIESSSTI